MSDKPKSVSSPMEQSWEQMRDESGNAYGRMIYLPRQKGHLLQIYNPYPPGAPGVAFAPDFSAWICPDQNPPPVPFPPIYDINVVVQMLAPMAAMLQTLSNGVNSMSGTVSNIDSVIAGQKASIEELFAVVDRALVYIQRIPEIVEAAVDKASQAAALNPEQAKAFDDMKAEMDSEKAKVISALPADPEPAPVEPPAPEPTPSEPPAPDQPPVVPPEEPPAAGA